MPQRKLTDRFCASAKPREGDIQTDYFDSDVRGLSLRVSTGRKAWTLHVTRSGKRARMTLGTYPELSLAEARTKAEDTRAGREPGRTFREIADEFLKRHTDEKSGNRWAAETRRILAHDILPALGDKTEMRKDDIHAMLDAIHDRGSPIAANRALAVVKKLFRWALGRGYVTIDPTAGIAKPADETKRDRVLSEDELACVWGAADAMAYPFGPALRMLILTGQRREEVGAMRWSEVDLASATWTLPAERSKNGVAHVVPLSAAALTIFASISIGRAGGFVFTTTGASPVSGWSKAKNNLDAIILDAMRDRDPAAEPIADWRLHDIRRTVATGLQRLGVRLEVTEAVLGHVSGSRAGVVGIYQRYSFADEKRQALDAWAALVARIVEPQENVVQLRADANG